MAWHEVNIAFEKESRRAINGGADDPSESKKAGRSAFSLCTGSIAPDTAWNS
jgi:hypothetical protein